MSDEDDTPTDEPDPPKAKTRTRKRTSTGGGSRFERRASKIADTLRQATSWSLPDLEALPFVETVKRDADRIGHSLAAVSEWFDPVGKFIDVVFGLTGPLAVFVGLSPTLQAAKRSAQEKLRERRLAKQRQAEEAQLDEQHPDENDPNGMPWAETVQSEPAETFDLA